MGKGLFKSPWGIGLVSLGILVGANLGVWNGKNYLKYENRVTVIGGDKKITRVYGPVSYLEIISGDENIKGVYKKSMIDDSIIVGFELNSKGKIEKMIEEPYLFKREKRISSPEKNPDIDWKSANKDAEKYVNYFKWK